MSKKVYILCVPLCVALNVYCFNIIEQKYPILIHLVFKTRHSQVSEPFQWNQGRINSVRNTSRHGNPVIGIQVTGTIPRETRSLEPYQGNYVEGSLVMGIMSSEFRSWGRSQGHPGHGNYTKVIQTIGTMPR